MVWEQQVCSGRNSVRHWTLNYMFCILLHPAMGLLAISITYEHIVLLLKNYFFQIITNKLWLKKTIGLLSEPYHAISAVHKYITEVISRVKWIKWCIKKEEHYRNTKEYLSEYLRKGFTSLVYESTTLFKKKKKSLSLFKQEFYWIFSIY